MFLLAEIITIFYNKPNDPNLNAMDVNLVMDITKVLFHI